MFHELQSHESDKYPAVQQQLPFYLEIHQLYSIHAGPWKV